MQLGETNKVEDVTTGLIRIFQINQANPKHLQKFKFNDLKAL
jgi:hypothetical protein